MRLIDYLDKGAALSADAPCLTIGERDMYYVDVQRVTWRVARALERAA
jgi:fatty-acyl-CoA synthase